MESAMPEEDMSFDDAPKPVANPVGDPIENSIGMVLVPIPAGEFMRDLGPTTDNGLFSFEGRVSRSTYWLVSIIACVVFWSAIRIFAPALQWAVRRGSLPGIGASLAVIVFSVPFLWVSLAVAVKRWHDLGKSGWMNLILFIPIVGAVYSLVVLGFRRGTVGKNQYDLDSISVTLTKSFHLGRTVVTQGQWEAVMGTTPWKGKPFVKEGDDYAASYVSWEDAVEFCRKLSEKEGVEYRLPTEAEWEYACRAGTTTAYSFGDDESQLGEYAWYAGNASLVGEEYAHIVGQKKPNPWGLHDMHGNVWEWCQDVYGEYARGDVTDPMGSPQGEIRVLRGGAFGNLASNLRSAYRGGNQPVNRYNYNGFRAARTYP